jgi:hypothetical protein
MANPDEPREADRSDGVRPPELIEYGSVAKLTQGGGMSGTDAMMMMLCL